MKKIKLLLALVLLFSCSILNVFGESNVEKFNEGAYWKKQALEEIIPFWIPTIDQKDGGFITNINRDGSINPNSALKYPRMVSRAVYGFCAAYLLSGDEKYLTFARHGLTYLQKYGWDQTYGGWYTELRDNKPTVLTKNLFDETYGNLGPIFYYYVTGDRQALELVEKTHRLMKEKAWDKEYQGYFAVVNRDWSISQTFKSFNSQIDTATAYLFYYYLSAKKLNLLKDLKEIGDVIVNRMYDPQTGYIRANFSRTWDYLDSYLGPGQIDIGHNMKTAWVLLRLYRLTGEKRYLTCAEKIAAKMLETGWDIQYGGWFFSKHVNHPARTASEKQKCWWTQTEGNFLMLNLYSLTSDQRYLDYFQKNASFWDQYLVDHQYKEVFAYTEQNGEPQYGLKGDLYKSAYHSMEHALMNYLYLQLYVHKETVELFFNLSAAVDGTRHYVKIIESPDVIIKRVEISGKDWTNFNAEECCLVLPKGKGMKVKVVLGIR